jgi:hypothetical protein
MSNLRVSQAKPPKSRVAKAFRAVKHKRWFHGVLIVLIAVGVYGMLKMIKTDPNQKLNDVGYVTSQINKHYILPTDEQPAMATISDKTKLGTEFLKKAENGDKVLIYQKAQRVIIYRPSADRIVDVGPVSIASSSSTSGQ